LQSWEAIIKFGGCFFCARKGGKEADGVGSEGEERIPAELLGEISGRFHYELVCDIGKRITRIYRKQGELFVESSE